MPMVVAAVGAVLAAVSTATAVVATAAGAAAAGLAGAVGVGVLGQLAIEGAIVAITPSLLVAGALEIGSILTAPHIGQTAAGTQVDWQADPTAPVPYLIGRTGTSGTIALQDVSGNNNSYLWTTTVYSGCGPVKSISGFTANDVAISFTSDGGEGAGAGSPTTSLTQAVPAGATVLPVASVQNFAAGQTITVGGESLVIDTVYSVGTEFSLKSGLAQAHAANTSVTGPGSTSFYQNRLWWKPTLGSKAGQFVTFTNTGSKDTPANHSGVPSTWSASCTMRGLAGSIMSCEFDAAKYPTGVIKPMIVCEGVMVYDPRQDSTYPGGVGSQRVSDESTWAYSQNPYLHALTWIIGRTANGQKTMGLHAPLNAIDIAAFVNGANVADSHGWTLGGVIYSTDGKRDVLTSMLKAGSGQAIPLGAKISCLVDAPTVSLDTLTGDDVVGDAQVAAIQPARSAPNTIWPRYREEAQGWQIVPTAAPIQVTAYFAHDGGQRSKEVTYQLCQSAGQVATLARYDIENGREFGPITLPCKPRWMGFKPGDSITVNEPEYGLNSQKCLILNRSVDPVTLICTLTLRSETDGKHAFALGETATPPAIPGLTGVDVFNVPEPLEADWLALGGELEGDGGSAPVILVTGTPSISTVARALIDYRLPGATVWSQAVGMDLVYGQPVSTQITGLPANSGFIVGVRYLSIRGIDSPRLELGTDQSPISTGDLTLDQEEQIVDGVHLAAATGGNALIDTDFQFVTDFWCQNYDETFSCGPSVRVLLNGKGALQRVTSGTPAAGKEFAIGQGYGGHLIAANEQEVRSYALPCKPGDKIEASAYAVCANVTRVNAEVYFWDKNGSSIAPQEIGPYITDFSAFSNTAGGISAMVRPGGFTTAPANTAYATLDVIAFTSGAGPASLTIQSPMLRIAQPGATELAAATPGVGLQNADVTGQNVAAGLANASPLATGNSLAVNDVANAQVALGSNSIIDSQFAHAATTMGTGYSSFGSVPIARGFTAGSSGTVVAFAFAQGNISAGGVFDILQSIPNLSAANCQRYALPVSTGDRLYGSAMCNYQNGATRVDVQVEWSNSSGGIFTESLCGSGGLANGGYSGDVNTSMSRVGGFVTAPAGAEYATLLVRVVIPAGCTSDGHSNCAQPFLAKVAANQQTPPAYTPGPADRNSDPTGDNVAASFQGKGTLASQNTVALGSQVTGSLGAGSVSYANGSTAQSLQPATSNADQTSGAVAAGTAGLGPLATAALTAAQIAGTFPNLVYNGGLSLQLEGFYTVGSVGFFSNPDGACVGFGGDPNGYCFLVGNSFPVFAGQPYTAQAEMYSGGLTAGSFKLDIEWFVNGAWNGTSPAVQTPYGPGWTPYSVIGYAPSGATAGRVRAYTDHATTSNTSVRRIKVAQGTQATVFTDEATTGALYTGGTSINSLKPEELGSNVTETRVAGGLNNAGTLAYYNDLTFAPTSTPGQKQIFSIPGVLQAGQGVSGDGSSFMAARTLYGGGSTVDSLKPAQAGSDVTASNTAASFAGKGSLASQNYLDWTNSGTNGGLANRPGWTNGTDTQGKLDSGQIGNAGNSNLATYWPATTGADKTGNATAADFTGRGSLAYQNRLTGGDQAPYPMSAATGAVFSPPYPLTSQGVGQVNVAAGSVRLTNGRTFSWGAQTFSNVGGEVWVFYNIGTGACDLQPPPATDALINNSYNYFPLGIQAPETSASGGAGGAPTYSPPTYTPPNGGGGGIGGGPRYGGNTGAQIP